MRHIAVGLLVVGGQTVGVAGTTTVARNVREFPSVLVQYCVKQAIEGAARRLRGPECPLVLLDFSTADGRPLGEELAKLGIRPDEYLLTRLWFYEGSRRPFCNPELAREAVTQRGSRVVFICSDRFMADSYDLEIVIIHEMLHSLGLGENPPSSREITAQVARRCGR